MIPKGAKGGRDVRLVRVSLAPGNEGFCCFRGINIILDLNLEIGQGTEIMT